MDLTPKKEEKEGFRIFGVVKKRGKLQRSESSLYSSELLFAFFFSFFLLSFLCGKDRFPIVFSSTDFPVNPFETDRCDFLLLFYIHCLLFLFIHIWVSNSNLGFFFFFFIVLNYGFLFLIGLDGDFL